MEKSRLIISCSPEGFSISGNIGQESYFTMDFDELHIGPASNWKNPHVLHCKGGARLFLTDADLKYVLEEYQRFVIKK